MYCSFHHIKCGNKCWSKQRRNQRAEYFVRFQPDLKRTVVSNVSDPSHGVSYCSGNRIGALSGFILSVLFWRAGAAYLSLGIKADSNKVQLRSQILVQVDHIHLTVVTGISCCIIPDTYPVSLSQCKRLCSHAWWHLLFTLIFRLKKALRLREDPTLHLPLSSWNLIRISQENSRSLFHKYWPKKGPWTSPRQPVLLLFMQMRCL